MKILITAGGRMSDLSFDGADITGTGDGYAINLGRELTRRGHRVRFAVVPAALSDPGITPAQIEACRLRFAGLEQFDHAISTLQNGFERRHPALYESIRAKVTGKVCTILDHDRGDGPEDLLLHARRPTGHAPGRSAYIGWAADDALFVPAKEEGWLTIFVDHKYYGDPDADWTERLVTQAMRFARAYQAGRYAQVAGKERARVIFLSPDGLVTIEAPQIRRYRFGKARQSWAKRVTQPELAAALARSDIYLVTHNETMGLATLEAAMAGALIVTPANFIRPELLQPLHHLAFEHGPDWAEALKRLDGEKSAALAREFTWPKLVDRLLAALESETGAHIGERRTLLAAPAGLRAWRKVGVRIGAGLFSRGPAITVRAAAVEGQHQLRAEFAKQPWPTLYTARFTIAARGCDGVSIMLAARARRGSRAEARFDLVRGRLSLAVGMGGWQVIGADLRPAGEGLWAVSFQAMSDHMPAIRARLAMLRGREPLFAPEGETELRIVAAEIVEGMSLPD